MDENEFADLLLEQTQALLIDVAEIPRPLEGDEVEQRMEGYSDEIAGIALKLPPTADRLGQQQGRRKQMSQGFGLPVSQRATCSTRQPAHATWSSTSRWRTKRLSGCLNTCPMLVGSCKPVQEMLELTRCYRRHRAQRQTRS